MTESDDYLETAPASAGSARSTIVPDNWTIPERYMVRYHLARLVWWALASISVVILALAAVFALTRMNFVAAMIGDATWWYATFIVTPAITASSFFVKPTALRRTGTEASLHRVVSVYKRAHLAVFVLCVVAAFIPCALSLLTGTFGYPLLIVVVPLAGLLVHFPHTEQFALFVDDLVAERPAK